METGPSAAAARPFTSNEERREDVRPRGFSAASDSEVRERLAQEVGLSQFERYFDGQTRLAMRNGRLQVTVASDVLAKLLDRRFGEQLRRTADASAKDAQASPDGVAVQFQVDRTAFAPAEPPGRARDGAAPGPNAPQAGSAARSKPPVRSSQSYLPSAKFRLDNFVVGKANRLAHSAAVRVAEEDGPNAPLFIHGSCGLGKSHLLQALAGRYLERRPTANVRYITAETFTNEFITAIRANKVDGFRRSYRRLDLLCLDDVHFLSNKEATQTELLFTFDAIGLDGARLVLASDEHPREIKKLSQRLVSRFLAGAVVAVETPDEDLRLQLVRHIAQKRNLAIDEAALKLLTDRSARSVGSLAGFGGSVREIEGLVNQVEAVHRLLPEIGQADGRVGLALVRRALGLTGAEGQGGSSPMPALRPRRPIAAETIVAEVCRSLAVDLSEFMGKGRHARVVLARSLASYLSRKLTTLSFPEIAKAMGRNNHSTIITAHRRLERQLGEVKELDAALAPHHVGLSLRELADLLCKQISRAAAGL